MNLLFIYTDEQRFDTFAGGGNPHIAAPHLNQLAAESTVFSHAYVTQPVCTASRSSIHTGMFPHATGCAGNNQPLHSHLRCLPELVRPGKYVTGHIGKWHLGDEIFAQHGFDEWVSIEDAYSPYYSAGRDKSRVSDYLRFLETNGFPPDANRKMCSRLPEPFTKASFVADEAVRFIERNKSSPFLLYVNFLEPHMPFYGPRNAQYAPSNLPLPGNFLCPPQPSEHLKKQLYYAAYRQHGFQTIRSPQGESQPEFPLQTETQWRRVMANYWGLVSLVDSCLGRILHAVESAGLVEDTLVVFTSDHGDMMGSHGLLAKCVPYEEAVRVPLMFRLPGRNGGHVPGRVSLVDLVPSLLTLLGQQVPEGLHGTSLFRNDSADLADIRNRNVFVEWNGADAGFDWLDELPFGLLPEVTPQVAAQAVADPVRTIITQNGWKLSISPGGFGHELFDLNNDPLELNNVWGLENTVDVACELHAQLGRWQERVGDPVALPALSELSLA